MDGEEVDPADLQLRLSDFLRAVVIAVVVSVITAVLVASMTEDPPPRPVARVTTEDLRAMADLARTIVARPDVTPAERRVARQLLEVVDAVEHGEVEIVPAHEREPSATVPPPPAELIRIPIPTTSTTTTTTTVPPTTTEPPPPPPTFPWPGVDPDAPPVTRPEPPVTFPRPPDVDPPPTTTTGG